MKKSVLFLLTLFVAAQVNAQEIIDLPFDEIPGVTYEGPEHQVYSEIWQTTVVGNVSKPTLMVYEPSADKRNGTAVIIAPGGGLYGLSINSEGVDVAQWLVSKGITAFVLKYRLVPTKEDATKEITEISQRDPQLFMKRVSEVLPYSVQDGLNALTYVRENAGKYEIKSNKIGFMGFSAGGAVTMGVAYGYDADNRPDFLVPVYAWTTAQPVQEPKDDAPTMLLICATDDGLGLASGSIDLYKSWYDKNLPVELHMFAQGNHGFGMKEQQLPSDHWIERFYDWAVAQKIVE